jgi:hypothetical protein
VRAPLVAILGTFAIVCPGCAPSTIRVVGVMHQSSEMRPLPAVPLGGYQQLYLFVHAAPDQSAGRYGSLDCGFARLEGSGEGYNNAACLPLETLNTAVGIVRQRLRSYGIHVVRDASDPYDYAVEVLVTGGAPKTPDRALVKALAKVTIKRNANAPGSTLAGSVDWSSAGEALDSAAKNCGLERAENASGFSASNEVPMTPDFDIVALAGGAVDNLLRCYDLANFFLDARTRFPKAGAPQGAPAL